MQQRSTTAAAMNKVGILGGMGPAAGADFVRLFVQACEKQLRSRGWPVNDQAYPEHWLVQLPVPDRTSSLLGGGPSPLPGMVHGVQSLARQGVTRIAIACNTAHAWHADLQDHCPGVELLHIVRETTRWLAHDSTDAVGLLATLGTYELGLYQAELARHGIACHLPTQTERQQLMRGIVDGVKGGQLPLARQLFGAVAAQMAQRHGLHRFVLACTEIPLALTQVPGHPGAQLVDPAAVLAQALAARAYAQ